MAVHLTSLSNPLSPMTAITGHSRCHENLILKWFISMPICCLIHPTFSTLSISSILFISLLLYTFVTPNQFSHLRSYSNLMQGPDSSVSHSIESCITLSYKARICTWLRTCFAFASCWSGCYECPSFLIWPYHLFSMPWDDYKVFFQHAFFSLFCSDTYACRPPCAAECCWKTLLGAFPFSLFAPPQ